MNSNIIIKSKITFYSICLKKMYINIFAKNIIDFLLFKMNNQ